MPAALVFVFLYVCNNPAGVPANASKTANEESARAELHPLITETNRQAAPFKKTDWTKWCSLYSDAYDSLLAVDPDPVKLYKQSLLDSIIAYSEFYTDSNAKAYLREAYYNRGYDFDELSAYYRAKDDYEKLLQLSKTVPFRSFHQEFMTLNSLANTYNRLGEIHQSELMRLRQIEKCILAKDDNKLATAYLNLGILYEDIGQPDTAIIILNKAIKLNDISTYSRAKLLSTLASAEASKGNNAAKAHSRQALELLGNYDEEGDTLYWMAGTYETLAHITHLNGDPQAENFYITAIQKKITYERTERKREIGKSYLALAKFYKDNNLPQKEISAIQKSLYTVSRADSADIFSLPAKERLYPENTIMEALDAKAGWMMRQALAGNNKQYGEHAIRCFELAFDIERILLYNFFYERSKLLFLPEGRRRSEKAIECSYFLYNQTGDISWIYKAWDFAEKSKAVILLQSILENILNNSLPKDTLYQKMEGLLQQVSAADLLLYEAKSRNEPDSLIRKHETNKKELEQQLLDAQIALRQENSSYRTLLESADTLDLENAEVKLLSSNQGLIEYFSGDSNTYAFCLLPGRQPVLSVLPRSVNGAVDSFLHYFKSKNTIINNPVAYQQSAYALYQTIIAPLITKQEINKLIIIPDGKLNVLPFDALLTRSSNSRNLGTLPYLVREYKLEFGYSIMTLLKQIVDNSGNNNVLGFAPVKFPRKPRLPALPHTNGEMTMIRKEHSNAVVFSYQNATIDNFRNQSHDASIIHIASHASANMQDSSRSAGETKPSIEFADSTLYLDELYNMHFHARLVVLSACESGTGKIETGEGAMSLARGFYYAGAGNIINSLWNVNDQSTAGLFNYFYSNIDDNSYSSSLQLAKLSYLEHEQSAEKASPFYWAGFIIIGHSREPAGMSKYWILLGVAAMLGVLILFGWRRNVKM